MRNEGRKNDALRPITIQRNYLRNAEGSVMVEFGNTRVICAATIEENIPKFLFGKGQGWITAEYGMLPRSTNQRMGRESVRGRGGRTYEIQRLIGRSLRASTQLDMLPEITVVVDCDVIEADGGTRTAAITGGCVALHDAISKLKLKEHPMNFLVSAVSLGLVNDQIILDLDYNEDSNAQVDMNVVMSEGGAWIEIQGTAEQRPFRGEELDIMLALAKKGCLELAGIQREVLGLKD